jgi:FkbM family methyltransferase
MLMDRLSAMARRHRTLRRTLAPAAALWRRWRQPDNAELNATLDRLAGLLAEDPILHIEEFDGNFALSPTSRLFRRLVEHGEYETLLTRRCIEWIDPARDALDIGANVGFHSVLFAKQLRQGRVLAVEPTRNAQMRLHANLARNGVTSRVTVFEGAAADADGMIEIKTIEGLEEFSSIGAMAHPSIAGRGFSVEQVKTRTIDRLVAKHGLDPGFMKVDVEGFEASVFEGARATIERCRPVVISELSDFLLRRNGSSAQALVRWFEALGYEVLDPLHPGEPAGSRAFGDMLCLPTRGAQPRAAGATRAA